MHISASQLSTFKECQRKWYFAYIIKRVKPSTDAMFKGTLFHKIFELHYKDNYDFPALVAYADKVAADKPAIKASVLGAFRKYKHKYPKRLESIKRDENDAPMCETGFTIKYSDDVDVIGFIDYLSTRTVKSYIVDIKVTAMGLTGWYFQGFELSYQTMLYSYVCSKLFPDINGFMIDAIQLKQNKIKEDTVDFATQFFPLSNNVESFERELHEIIHHISTYRESGKECFSHNYCSCVTKYGRCPYYNICLMDEEVQEEALLMDDRYEVKGSREENDKKMEANPVITI